MAKRPFSIIGFRPHEAPITRTYATLDAARTAAKALAIETQDSVTVHVRDPRGNHQYLGMCHKTGGCHGLSTEPISPAWLVNVS